MSRKTLRTTRLRRKRGGQKRIFLRKKRVRRRWLELTV